MEIFVWVKGLFKKGLCQKINILTVESKKVPLNSMAFLSIRICDKNNLSTRAHHLNNNKTEVINFIPEKNVHGTWCNIFGVQYIKSEKNLTAQIIN